jgi:hypothetical protein
MRSDRAFKSGLGALRRRLSLVNAAATIALVFVLGGGSALAAVSLASKPKPKPHPKPKLTLNSTDKSFISSLISAGHVAFATSATTAASATTATNATNATNATTAATATNAASLGGIAASGYTRNDCASLTGQIKGFATVPASPTFPSTFTAVQGYSCSGQAIQAKRIGPGDYEVQFVGSGPAIAIGNIDLASNGTPGLVGFLSIRTIAGGDFEVYVYNPNAGGNHLEDDQFSIVTP